MTDKPTALPSFFQGAETPRGYEDYYRDFFSAPNRDLRERFLAAAEGLTLRGQRVRGHRGNTWNERADQLTTEASAEAARRGRLKVDCRSAES